MYIALQITFFASMLVAVVNVFSLIAQQIRNKSFKNHRRGAPKKLFNDNGLQFEDGVLSTTYIFEAPIFSGCTISVHHFTSGKHSKFYSNFWMKKGSF